MNLCSDGHGEVCFEGRDCPACEAQEDLQSIIDDLRTELSDAQKELGEQDAELAMLRASKGD